MHKEKSTKIYTGKSATDTNKKIHSSKGPKKPGNNPFEKIIIEIKKVIAKALAGSTKHIAILVCGALVTVAVLGGAIYGITQIAGSSSGSNVEFEEIEFDPEADNNYNKNEAAIDKDKLSATILPETEDAGQKYIDNTLFIGDSNTVRSLMYETTGTTWENILGIVGIGVQHVAAEPQYKINFAGMSQPVDILTAVTMIQPQRVIMTFGTNNATWDVNSFIDAYKKAAQAIYDAYPYSDIIVNAIPPVDKLRDYPNITMQQIDKFNAALAQMCDEEGWKFLDSSEALKDEETGFAKKDYTISDGIHLSKNGFEALFDYIRTHAYETEDRRPKDEKGNLKYCPKRNEKEMPTIIEDPIAIRGGVTVRFVSDNYELGSIDGEVEQYTKYTKSTDAITAKPKTDNGGIFAGWECSYGGISDVGSEQITYTVPHLSEEITEIVVTAKFTKAKISISKSSATLDEGASTTLSASISEAFKGDKTISWSSDKPEIAKVDENGKVTAVAAGTAKITASALGGKLQATCTVTVDTILQQIKIDAPEAAEDVKVGDKALEFKVVAVPDGAKIGNIEWSTSDKEIATIDPVTGLLKPLKAGKVIITAKVKDRDLKDTYELEIKDGSSASSSESGSSSSSGSSSESSSASDSSSSSNSASSSSSESAVCAHDSLAEGASCTVCNAFTKPCATCGLTGHTSATAHCPECKSTEHTNSECKAATCAHDSLAEGASCTVCNAFTKPCATCGLTGHTSATAHCPTCKAIDHSNNECVPQCAHDSLAEGASCTVCNAFTKPCAACGVAGHTSATAHCPTCNATDHSNNECQVVTSEDVSE